SAMAGPSRGRTVLPPLHDEGECLRHRGGRPLPRSRPTVAVPRLRIADEEDATAERQLVAAERDVQIVVGLGFFGTVNGTLPLVPAGFAPTLEDPQTDDRPVLERRVRIASV